jgi:hypothetical protein
MNIHHKNPRIDFMLTVGLGLRFILPFSLNLFKSNLGLLLSSIFYNYFIQGNLNLINKNTSIPDRKYLCT